MMDKFNCSIWQLLNTLYPKYQWKPWLFKQVIKGFWPVKKNRVAYMRWLEKRLGYEKPEDWYQVTKLDFIKNNGGSLMAPKGSEVIDYVRELYPKRKWYQWCFVQVSQGFWKKKTNRIEYLKWLQRKLGFRKPEEWYKVRTEDFNIHGGHHLLSDHYKKDVCRALKELFPSHKWLPWKFHQVPIGFWDSPKNARRFLAWMGRQMNVTRRIDWYSVKKSAFQEHGGNAFLRRFGSLRLGLSFAYPNYDWHPWMFRKTPSGVWNSRKNRVMYYRWLAKRLSFKNSADWESLTTSQLVANYGQTLSLTLPLGKIVIEAKQQIL